MQGLKALMGLPAILAPLGFVIGADLASPKNKGIVTVMINVATWLEYFVSSALMIHFGSGKPYSTANMLIVSIEYNDTNIKSYRDAQYWSIGFFVFGLLMFVFAMRKLRKMGVTAPKSD